MIEIKTASDLKYAVESRDGEDSHYFSRENMRLFGDTMRNYGVRKVRILCNYDADGKYYPEGIERDAWELYRRKPVKAGNQRSAYFCAESFRTIFKRETPRESF